MINEPLPASEAGAASHEYCRPGPFRQRGVSGDLAVKVHRAHEQQAIILHSAGSWLPCNACLLRLCLGLCDDYIYVCGGEVVCVCVCVCVFAVCVFWNTLLLLGPEQSA